MTGSAVTFLSEVRAARSGGRGPDVRLETAGRYVRLAEEAIALACAAEDDNRRCAIWGIAETWLSLAEAELAGR